MISTDLLTKEYLLGKGAFGSVFKGELYDNDKVSKRERLINTVNTRNDLNLKV